MRLPIVSNFFQTAIISFEFLSLLPVLDLHDLACRRPVFFRGLLVAIASSERNGSLLGLVAERHQGLLGACA